FLHSHGAKIVPWRQATSSGGFACDVSVSASANGDLHRLPGELLLVPHGAGHLKFRATDEGVDETVSGLSPDQLRHDGEVIPSVIALSGREPMNRLRRSCPDAAARAELTGDVCLERLLASRPHRGRYRRGLGVHDDQKLVLLSSTWGSESLLGRLPKLADRLLAELPADEFRVAAALHPNCWDRHGRPQVYGWLEAARRAGLAVIPPHEGWRAVLAASDCVVGDHGSTILYGASLDKPLVFAAFGWSEVPGDSPAAALGRAAPQLDPDSDLLPQIRETIASHDPGRYAGIAAEALDPEPSAGDRLRQILYRLLRLDPPGPPPAPQPLPPPDVDWTPATAHYVYPIETTESARSGLTLTRYPTAAEPAARERPYRERILVVDAAEPDQRLWHAASASTWTETPLTLDEAARWTREQLDACPGMELAAAAMRGDCFLARSRRLGAFVGRSDFRFDLSVAAAAIYRGTLDSEMPTTLRFREGFRNLAVTLTPSRVDEDASGT
ncbi:MAG: hypothetical protein ACRDXX_21575, partial [Stackebrandtia sp.]